MPELIVLCDGRAWQGITTASIKLSMSQAAPSFTLSTTDAKAAGIANWNVKGGSLIDIMLDGEMLVRGYVRKYAVAISDSSHEISIEGDGLAIDIVECAHKGPFFWRGGTSAEAAIREILSPFGLTAVIDGGLTPFPKTGFKVKPDVLAFDAVLAIAARNKKSVYTQGGVLRITDQSAAIDAGTLERGDYVSINADHDLSTSYSEIIVKNQQNTKAVKGKAAFKGLQSRASNTLNPAMARYRPVVYTDSSDNKEADAMANFIRARFTADVITATVTVKSLYNKRGARWDINQALYISEPLLDLSQRLLISDVAYDISDSSGLTVAFTLAVPQSFDNKAAAPQALRQARKTGRVRQNIIADPVNPYYANQAAINAEIARQKAAQAVLISELP